MYNLYFLAIKQDLNTLLVRNTVSCQTTAYSPSHHCASNGSIEH